MEVSIFKISKRKGNIVTVTKNLIKQLKLPITNSTISASLLMHPEYPALSALSDVLWDWNIENLPVNLPANRLNEIEYPVVAYLKENGGQFVLLTSFENGQIRYLSDSGNRVVQNITEFKKKWEGTLLLIGTTEYAVASNYAKNRIKEIRHYIGKWGLSIIGMLLLLLFMVKISPIVGLGILLTKIVGIIISGLLLSKEFGNQHYLLKKICQVNTRTSCDTVLQSPIASFGGWFSLAELGLVYFLGGLIVLSFAGIGNWSIPIFNFLALVAIFSLPFSLFSIYYQGVILKKWCVLCLLIQGLLWIEFLLLMTPFNNFSFTFSILNLSVIASSFLLPIFLWLLCKPFLKMKEANQVLSKQITALKQNTSSFKATLESLPNTMDNTSHDKDLTIGNKAAPKQLLVVLSFHCIGCAKALKELIALPHLLEDIHITIRFVIKNKENEALATYLYDLQATQGNEIALKALTMWYNSKELKALKNQFPLESKLLTDENKNNFLQQNDKWLKNINIAYTPLFIINHQKIPIDYTLADIKYHLRNMESISELTT